MPMPDTNQSAFDFWEQIYRKSSAETNGKPSAVLADYVADRVPGRALDLGCSKGDDAVWLAGRGWTVTAVDISSTVLGYAQANARKHAVADRIDFRQMDLAVDFPDQRFDLVYAMFLETPIEFPRAQVFRRAAAAVELGGLLLLVSHGSAAPWSWGDPDRSFATAREEIGQLDLDPAEWDEIFVGSTDREATGPGGQKAIVADTIIAISRL